jgi:uncharacterized protein YpiB (UPF0302 family)
MCAIPVRSVTFLNFAVTLCLIIYIMLRYALQFYVHFIDTLSLHAAYLRLLYLDVDTQAFCVLKCH